MTKQKLLSCEKEKNPEILLNLISLYFIFVKLKEGRNVEIKIRHKHFKNVRNKNNLL